MADQDDYSNLAELAKYLKANLLLQLRALSEDEKTKVKPELLLYRAGFSRAEIAELLGKNYEAVKKTLQSVKTGSKETEIQVPKTNSDVEK
jgi:DNA-directed RNA polymerase specialized sigma24 family protein